MTFMDVNAALARVGVRVPDIVLPRPGIDLTAWAVIACDQFTSQPDYWQRVNEIVGSRPSTLRLIYPEVYLDEPDPQPRISSINATMREYLADDLLVTHPETMVLVRRETSTGIVRWGLMLALDLEQYSWEPDARTLIRATEGTILDRLPPRVMVREGAELELPHIMVLISDAGRSVVEPLAAATDRLTKLYDTELMLGGGRVAGWAVDSDDDLAAAASGLGRLLDALDPDDPLLFAMGDGNHSFATAKSIWENVKGTIPWEEWDGHPARYCLVEVENIHDEGLEFEPIHRVLFGVDRERFEAELGRRCRSFSRDDQAGLEAVVSGIEVADAQVFGYVDPVGAALYRLSTPAASLAAGTLQLVIDDLVTSAGVSVDYIHGADVTAELGGQSGNVGLLLPPLDKHRFFASIVADGALPRKTFSLGEASDKRYYLEARAIS